LQQVGNAEPARGVQDQRGVARAAAADVVTDIEQHHRASLGGLRLAQCLVDRHRTAVERSTHLPGRLGQRLTTSRASAVSWSVTAMKDMPISGTSAYG
jgi:hypothetical protein